MTGRAAWALSPDGDGRSRVQIDTVGPYGLRSSTILTCFPPHPPLAAYTIACSLQSILGKEGAADRNASSHFLLYEGADLHEIRPPVIDTAQIYTVGYQLRSAEEMIELVRENGVDVLIDVRQYPSSRKKGLSKTPLHDRLRQHGMAYHHAKFAGNPKRFRDTADSHEECLQMYEAHLEANPKITRDFRALVTEFLEDGDTICLMCYERHPLDCHRSILLRRAGLAEGAVHLGTRGADRFTKREAPLDA